MLIRGSIVLIAFIILSQEAHANFDFNSNCVKAYQSILSLKLNNARSLISAEKKIHPGNSIPYLLDNYVDYFSLLTTESKADFDRLKTNKSSRLSRMEKDDKNSPYYLFAQAEINLQWSLTRGRFRSILLLVWNLTGLLTFSRKILRNFLPSFPIKWV